MNRAIVLTDGGQLFLPMMLVNKVIKIGRSRIKAACRADVLVCSCCCLLPFTAPWWTKFSACSLFGFRIALLGLFPWLKIIDIGANFPICDNELGNFRSNPENK